MKPGAVVWTEDTKLSVFLYPYGKPIKEDTICSVLSNEDNQIYHVTYSEIKPYTECCRGMGCTPEPLLIVDDSDPSRWEEVTGLSMADFNEYFLNYKYCSLYIRNRNDIERACELLIQSNLRPLLVIREVGTVSLYVEASRLNAALAVLQPIGNPLCLICPDKIS